ncbi:hypothetical protein BRARA_D01596 [Brassica rapa]|uniref:Purple acid phosphatase C-terminal domain-containing protein n=1 Tax=Brassica campestris TaxID=3711 RepID=A0A397ZLD3_BRACM|nr:hypothetical protein BRARA_D01596 [Brassica rapa]
MKTSRNRVTVRLSYWTGVFEYSWPVDWRVTAQCEAKASAPVYITIGDGGNSEGLLTDMMQPQPSYSAFREPSFGHGLLDIKNRTHAYFNWNRNQDGSSVEADSVWLLNRFWRAPKKTMVVAS